MEYSSLFEGTLIEELHALKREIAYINTVSYDEFDSVFNFTVFSSDYTLPTYRGVFFPDGKTPNYVPPSITIGMFL